MTVSIPGVERPFCIQINETLRLRRYDGTADFALAWYQDEELVYLVDGVKKPYDRATLNGMYGYLDAHGSCTLSKRWKKASGRPSGT